MIDVFLEILRKRLVEVCDFFEFPMNFCFVKVLFSLGDFLNKGNTVSIVRKLHRPCKKRLKLS